MNMHTIPTAALGGSLKLVRLPVDAALSLGGERSSTTTVKLALDRAEATLLGVAGTALGNDAVKQDARRRHEAAREREYALRLRAQAAQRSARADERVTELQDDADRLRADADATAEKKRKQAERKRQATRRQAARAAERRKDAVQESAARSEQAIDEHAKHERLEVLDTKAQALDEQELALTAAEQAQHLSEAAAAAKASRKNGG